MTVGDVEVAPAVVVKINQPDAPGHVGQTVAQAGAGRLVHEQAVEVAVESVRVAGEVGDHQIEPAVVVVVGPISAHAGLRVAVLVVGDARLDGDLGEAAAVVAEQEVRHRIVGDEQVRVAVAVIVGGADAQPERRRRRAEAGFEGALGEGAVAAVAIVGVADRDEAARSARDVDRQVGAVAG